MNSRFIHYDVAMALPIFGQMLGFLQTSQASRSITIHVGAAVRPPQSAIQGSKQGVLSTIS